MQNIRCPDNDFEGDDYVRMVNERIAKNRSLIRITNYNPMSMKQDGRWIDVLKAFKGFQVIGLNGTCTRAKLGQEYVVKSHKNFEVIEWGWASRELSNCKCGVAIALSKNRFPRNCWRQIHCPIKKMAGRLGAVRIKKGNLDVCFIVFMVMLNQKLDQRERLKKSTAKSAMTSLRSSSHHFQRDVRRSY